LARSVNQVTYLNKLNCRFHLGYLGGFKVTSNFKLFSDIEKFDINKHFSYVGFNICNSLNLKIDKTLMSMNYPSSVVNNVNKFKKNLQFDDSKPIIGLNTNVHWESRRWSEDNYISLVERLYDKFNFVLLGGPGPDEILNNYIEKNLLDKGIKIFNSTSKLKLIELPQFISTLDFMITSDSGPMHIGILMRTPTLALFGPIDPNLRFPFDYKKNHIIDYLWYLDYAKGGVYDYHSEYVDKNMNGLKAISVEFVCEKTLNFFKNNKFTYIK
ncbi:MAG: glycosyltransferase family 9 protein, partial [Nanoarchaeales archaeon]|nr:glycosyltransferase family 9 protein [Nanoarchaeales archaeon]